MTERTYPREWFEATVWSAQPRAETFYRETDKSLFGRAWRGEERATRKVGKNSEWFPTLEEAQAKIDEFTAKRNERRRINLIRDAAPELFEALEELVDAVRSDVDKLRGLARAEEAIAKAKGETT